MALSCDLINVNVINALRKLRKIQFQKDVKPTVSARNHHDWGRGGYQSQSLENSFQTGRSTKRVSLRLKEGGAFSDNYLSPGWVRVILPPVQTNHRKEIRVRMIDRDHSLRKGGIKIDVWQMRKLEL